MDFKTLKKTSKASFSKLNEELEKLRSSSTGANGSGNENQWKLVVDKSGNGSAIIRFLPAPPGEDLPWVRIWDHGFQGPTGQWYIENSLTTLGKEDPVSEYNSELWATGLESNKDLARKQKRRLKYWSNIFVVKDPANPENEGKVFLFAFGKKIFDKLNDLMNPEFEDEKPVNPFDLWEGANFKLRARQVDGFRNYDRSEFESPAPLADDDAALEQIWKQEYSLQEIVDPKQFKSYDELKARLTRVLGLGETSFGVGAPEVVPAPPIPSKVRSLPTAEADALASSDHDDDDEDDGLSYFESLANED